MKKFEMQLKAIQSAVRANEFACAFAPDLEIDDCDLQFLSSKGLIELHPAGDDQLYIALNGPGYTYFDDKQEARKAFIQEHLFKFIFGFFSGTLVGVFTTILSAWLLGFLKLPT